MGKVIVLDDNAAMLAVLSEIVGYMGHEVLTFERVEPFLEQMQHEIPDCLIVDARLKDHCNGLDVIEQVQHMPGTESLRYILLTASSELLPLRSHLRQRHIELLTKPCSIAELEMALV